MLKVFCEKSKAIEKNITQRKMFDGHAVSGYAWMLKGIQFFLRSIFMFRLDDELQ